MLTFFLPGSSFPILKPELPGRVFASVVYDELYADSMRAVHPPSLLGDAYINFWGWPGLLALFFNGMVVSWLTQRVYSSMLWFCGVGPHVAWFTVLGTRGNPYDYYVMAIAMLVLTWVILKAFQPARRPPHAERDTLGARGVACGHLLRVEANHGERQAGAGERRQQQGLVREHREQAEIVGRHPPRQQRVEAEVRGDPGQVQEPSHDGSHRERAPANSDRRACCGDAFSGRAGFAAPRRDDRHGETPVNGRELPLWA